jgi:hypothetical protein
MAEPEQMTRQQLLAARERDAAQFEQYNTTGGYSVQPGTPRTNTKRELLAELQAILQEIDAELAELDSNNA